MTASLVFEQVINGLMIGAIYALFAIGLALIMGVMDVVNTAHGEVFMLGAYAALGAITYIGVGPILYLPLAALAGFVIGAVIDVVVVRPLRVRREVDLHLASMILMFGVGMILQNSALLLFGPKFLKAPELLSGATEILGMIFINDYLLTAAISLILMTAVAVFLRWTKLGRSIRATAQNPNAAQLVGINPAFIGTLTFGIGAALAALAGALLGPLYYINPTMGSNILLKGFAVVIVGGMGNVYGAVVAAFILGISESVGATFLSYGYKDAIGFFLLAFALLVRPQGLFGAQVRV